MLVVETVAKIRRDHHRGKPIKAIVRETGLEIIRRIETRGAQDISRRAKRGLGQVFRFAIACRLASSDPTANLRGALKPRPRLKQMNRLPLVELPASIEKLRGYVRERSPDGSFNHTHSIARDPANDYGAKWLEQHYTKAHQE